jgi:hypothetical protein
MKERSRERALDRRLRPDEIEEQRRAMEDASFAQLYPAFADKLADLLPRIEANDREVAYVNNRLPSGCSPLLVAELIARGLQGFAQDGLSTPRITSQLRLPAFKRCPSAPYAWPRSETERPNAVISALMKRARRENGEIRWQSYTETRCARPAPSSMSDHAHL